MSGKLSEVEGRIGTVHQLEAVITAMRGSAAARSREARGRLDGIRAYAAVIGQAIGEAVALAPEADPQPRKSVHLEGRIVIALCAEQGFAGTFNERVLDAAEDHLKFTGSELLVVGDRGAMVAAERGLVIGWSAPMVAHADEVPLLANRITDALYSRLANGQVTRVTVIHSVPAPSASIEIVERALLPFDFTRFKVAQNAVAPLTTVPAEQLLAELAEEYVYAELCEEVMLSFAAENEARMRAMIAARSNVSRKLDELVGSYRRLRQEEITGEIIELCGGTITASDTPKRKPERNSRILAAGMREPVPAATTPAAGG
jgi:F-type H+-transporting ATPase subunit gamma